MNDQVLRFRDLINSESVQRKRTVDRLLPFKSEIKEARLRKFSHQQIAKFLTQVGVDVSRFQVRDFCLSELGEKVQMRVAVI